MAKFTNKFGAHKAIVNAVEIDNHVVHGDISVTQLMGPPMARYLKNKYRGDERIKPDVRDQFWMLFGTICHEILEQGNVTYRDYWTFKKAAVVIKRHAQNDRDLKAAEYVKQMGERVLGAKLDKDLFLERTLSVDYGGMVISGTQDIFHAGKKILEDWKTCTAGSVLYWESEKRDWEIQQNIYAWMLRRHGYQVEKIRILAIYRDWSKAKVYRSNNGSYPSQPWDIFELPIWPDEKVEAYLDSRIHAHKQADAGFPRECTSKERWGKEDEYAVMQTGTTHRAIRRFDSREKAEEYIEEYGFRLLKPWIEERKGFDMKCKFFCNVAEVCETYQKRKENKMTFEIRKERRKVNKEKVIELNKEKLEADARTFDADAFLKKNHKTITEFRQDNPELYEEERNDKRYKLDKPDEYDGELRH